MATSTEQARCDDQEKVGDPGEGDAGGDEADREEPIRKAAIDRQDAFVE
jgi:hypothetical protein